MPTIPTLGTASAKLPLSHSQERLLYLEQYSDAEASFNVVLPLQVRGALAVDALERSLMELVRRHESLRTRIERADGSYWRVIDSSETFRVQWADRSGVPSHIRRTQLETLISEEVRRRVTFDVNPLFRAMVIRHSDIDHVLVIVVHHIVADGVSLQILMRDLSELYRSFVCNSVHSPTQPESTFSDYVVWEQTRLNDTAMARRLGFWTRQLANLDTLSLPLDMPRSASTSGKRAEVQFDIPQDLFGGVTALARGAGATKYLVLLCGFLVLLSRWTGSKDVAVGTPVANRMDHRWRNVVGCFFNTIVLRSMINGEGTFIEFIKQTKKFAAAAFVFQDTPFARLVAKLQPDRTASHFPLFQVMFSFLRCNATPLELSDLQVSAISASPPDARMDLVLDIREHASRFAASITYNVDLFKRESIERLANYYNVLLRAAIGDGPKQLRDLPLLSPDDQARILAYSRGPFAATPAEPHIHRLFEQQVARTPHSVAARHLNHSITYRELDSRATRLAERLKDQGVVPNAVVAVCIDRSIEMLIALLGILKAGASYVPISPQCPVNRLNFMLRDVGADLLVTSQVTKLSPEIAARQRICVDEPERNVGDQVEGARRNGSALGSVAYCIHTSGSTGQPKAVAVRHSSVCNLLCSMISILNATSAEVWLSVTPYTFDIFGLDIYLPLILGGSVVLATAEEASDVNALVRLCVRHKVTTMQATPATWSMFKAHDARLALGKVLCGGEVLDQRLDGYLQGISMSVWNMYGPTETTIWSSFARSKPDECPTLGHPVANTAIYILDEWRNLVPLGVAGELYIAGDGLADGYVGRPELTAARFVEDPFGPPGSRMYRTGDTGRRRTDGAIEFLGRNDQQVKIRGHRVEFGEIEAALMSCDLVAAAVVETRDLSSGGRKLVAFVVLRGARNAGPDELINYLSGRLPDYMIPAEWQLLDALPVTANGKIDRRLLKELRLDPPVPESMFRAAETSTEKLLAELWGELLSVSAIGTEDNFIALGGHSLMAVHVVVWAKKVMGIALTPREILQAPTLRKLAQLIDQLRTQPLDRSIIPRRSVSVPSGLFNGESPDLL